MVGLYPLIFDTPPDCADVTAIPFLGWIRAISPSVVNLETEGGINMAQAYSYACKDCEGMEDCPASVVAETKEEVWKLMELHALVAHDEKASDWDGDTRAYLETLIKPVVV